MDGDRFDEFARRLGATVQPRRAAARLLAGAGLGALLTALGREEVEACVGPGRRCQKKHRPGQPFQRCCQGLPCAGSGWCGGAPPGATCSGPVGSPGGCGPNSYCRNRRCTCLPGFVKKAWRCVPCQGLSGACTNHVDCCGAACEAVDAAKQDGASCPTAGTPKVCCRQRRASCDNSCQCCGSDVCRNGICGPSCVPLGAPCERFRPCCDDGVCPNGVCERRCVPSDGSCTTHEECCPLYLCLGQPGRCRQIG